MLSPKTIHSSLTPAPRSALPDGKASVGSCYLHPVPLRPPQELRSPTARQMPKTLTFLAPVTAAASLAALVFLTPTG